VRSPKRREAFPAKRPYHFRQQPTLLRPESTPPPGEPKDSLVGAKARDDTSSPRGVGAAARARLQRRDAPSGLTGETRESTDRGPLSRIIDERWSVPPRK